MKKHSSSNSTILYGLIAVSVLAIAGGVFYAVQESGKPVASAHAAAPASAGPLSTPSGAYDFGKISMAAGKVSHKFWITNSGNSPVTVSKIFTSCMCTEASFLTATAKRGPFGMPGMGPQTPISERMEPGQSAQIEVIFDPAAHGPAGVGPADRVVTVENTGGGPLELMTSAVVTP